MSLHFSVRDVTFTPTSEGVRIVAETDVPCHLYCRLSPKQPWIHKKPVLRRGLRISDDVRFCFTVYEDNEQSEPGDTTSHTFAKTGWPPCITKWLYLWATITGEVCVSTSPLFKHHNIGLPPPPFVHIFTESWTIYGYRLIFTEPWSMLGYRLLFTEPWSSLGYRLVFTEPWSEYGSLYSLIHFERWIE